MAADDNDQNAKYALSKLLQMGTMAEYQNEFEMLIKRVTIPESLLKSYPSTLGEAFFRDRITKARFEDENNQPVDANVGDQEEPEVKDKQEVKNANNQEIENIQDEEGKNVEDQQVSEADDDTNIDDLVVHYIEEDGDEQGKKKKNKWVITFFKIGANKDSNPNGVFNDVGGVGYSKADGTWVPARRIEDGARTRYSGANLSLLLLYILTEQAYAKSGALSRYNPEQG
ncbi:hypothetical protein Tco_0389037, partial [Tanacetum coccineum]